MIGEQPYQIALLLSHIHQMLNSSWSSVCFTLLSLLPPSLPLHWEKRMTWMGDEASVAFFYHCTVRLVWQVLTMPVCLRVRIIKMTTWCRKAHIWGLNWGKRALKAYQILPLPWPLQENAHTWGLGKTSPQHNSHSSWLVSSVCTVIMSMVWQDMLKEGWRNSGYYRYISWNR